MSNIVSDKNEDQILRSTYVSSRHFQDKVSLIKRKELFNRDEIFVVGDVSVRRYTGVFWKSYRLKLCALEKKGRLYIYSKKSNRGLSLNLSELKLKEFYTQKITSKKEAKYKAEIYLSDRKGKLCLCLKGSRDVVTKWRCGLICAHKGIILGSASEVDEIAWSQKNAPKLLTENIIADSLDSCNLDVTYTNDILSQSLPLESFMESYANNSDAKYCSLTFDPRCDSKLMSPSKLSAVLSRRSSSSIPFYTIQEDPNEDRSSLNKTDTSAFVTCHEDFYVYKPYVSKYVPGIPMLSASIIPVDKFNNLQSSMESLNLCF